MTGGGDVGGFSWDGFGCCFPFPVADGVCVLEAVWLGPAFSSPSSSANLWVFASGFSSVGTLFLDLEERLGSAKTGFSSNGELVWTGSGEALNSLGTGLQLAPWGSSSSKPSSSSGGFAAASLLPGAGNCSCALPRPRPLSPRPFGFRLFFFLFPGPGADMLNKMKAYTFQLNTYTAIHLITLKYNWILTVVNIHTTSLASIDNLWQKQNLLTRLVLLGNNHDVTITVQPMDWYFQFLERNCSIPGHPSAFPLTFQFQGKTRTFKGTRRS